MNGYRFRKQAGATLMEVLVAMTISLIATAAMIAMMSNSLGTTTRIIQMTKLTDDMRVVMQMMTRDVRRSSYNAQARLCYANHDCGTDTSGLTVADDVQINLAENCFTFLTDRDHDGNSTEDGAGGFRHVVPDPVSGSGVIEMWTGNNSPDCGSLPGSPGWVQITDPEKMDIFFFRVDDDQSYEQEIVNNGSIIVNQRVRKIHIDMSGQLVFDNSIRRQIEDVVDVRNDMLL